MDSPRAVFLSYASEDAAAVAQVRDGLEKAGIEVWLDQSELKGGDAWDAAIRKRIKDCTLFVPVVSAATEKRDEGYFRLEWKLAVDRSHLMAEDKAFLLPVSLDGTTQQSARVPDRFREVQWSRVSGLEEIAAFANHVVRLLEGASPAARAPATSAPRPASGPATPSIAVLPFVNMSRDEENEYFADGLSEELLNVLAHIRGLRVASRTSAFHFKGKNAPIASIAQQLGVATILEGSVRKSGKRVRVTAQLIEVATDSHLWSRTYDRDLDDIFAVQDDIAQAVVLELRRTLMGDGARTDGAAVAGEVRSAATGRTDDAEAHRLYLQGRFFAQRSTKDETLKAVELFEQAIARDPNFAAGWAGLSISTWTLAGHSWVPAAEGFERSRAAARRALELDPDLAEAHIAMARLHMVDWKWDAARESLERARSIAPGDAQVLRALGRLLITLGRREESLECYRQAVELDPLNYGGLFNLGAYYFFAGRLQEAEELIRRALELNPLGGMSHGMLAFIHLSRGELAQCLEESRQESNAIPRLSSEAMAQHSLGHADLSDRAIAAMLEHSGDDAAFNVAQVFAWRGEADRVFEWLERARVARDVGISNLLFDPFLAPFRADPRYRALLKKIGLPS